MAQFKGDDRFQFPLSAPSALDEMCHPIEKIAAMGEIICAMNESLRDSPFCNISTAAVATIGSIIEDAVEDLMFLQKIAGKQANLVRSDLQFAATELTRYRKREQQEETA